VVATGRKRRCSEREAGESAEVGLGFYSLPYPVTYDRRAEESIALRKVEYFIQRTEELNKGAFPTPRPLGGIHHPYNSQLSALKRNRPNLPQGHAMPATVRMVLTSVFPGWNSNNNSPSEPKSPQRKGEYF